MRAVDLQEVWDARRADRRFFAALATLAFVALGLQMVVGGTALTFTGEAPDYFPLGVQLLVWTGLGILWAAIARALMGWCRRRGVDPLPSNRPGGPGHRGWTTVFVSFVLAVLAALLVPLFSGLPWGMAPVSLYNALYSEYGSVAWLPTVAWGISHVGRSLLIISAVAYAHEAVVHDRRTSPATLIPWGGLVMGILLTVIALLSHGPAVALATVVVLPLLGVAYVASGRSLRVSAPLAVVFLALL